MIHYIFLQVIAAFFATLFFGILFEIPKDKLFSTGIGGGICWFCYSILHVMGLSTVIAAFIASFLISTYAELMARSQRTPVTIYLVTGILPLVPGGGMYSMMLAAIQQRFGDAAALGSETLQTAGVIAASIVIVSSISKIITGLNNSAK